MKQITNLAITGITTTEQLDKLAKLTNTKVVHEGIPPKVLREDNTPSTSARVVYYINEKLGYNDWIDERWVTGTRDFLTWEEVLAKYDKPCAKLKKENKRLRKQLKLETVITDKAYVEAWDEPAFARAVGFYDSVNKCLFSSLGKRDGSEFNNYKQNKKLPKWAKEAQKQLGD